MNRQFGDVHCVAVIGPEDRRKSDAVESMICSKYLFYIIDWIHKKIIKLIFEVTQYNRIFRGVLYHVDRDVGDREKFSVSYCRRTEKILLTQNLTDTVRLNLSTFLMLSPAPSA